MSKPLPYVFFTSLIAALLGVRASAQDFRWPREKAFEVGAGASATGVQVQAGVVRYFQPRKTTEIPFTKRYKSLIGRDRYVAFPCKQKQRYKIPPGLSIKASLFYELGSSKTFPYQVVGVDAALMYMIYHNKYLYISLKGGVTASHNRLLKQYQLEHYDRFKYGVLGGAEMERMIDRRQYKSVVIGWQQYYLAKGDSWGSTRWYVFIALRFKIPNNPKV